jgi:ubiquitin carboxyl-terminal hydrolase 48
MFTCDARVLGGRRRRGLFDTDFLQLLSHVVLGTILSKLMPFLYGAKPALLKLGSADTRYSTITAAVRRDSLLAAVGFAALGLWLSFKIAARFL